MQKKINLAFFLSCSVAYCGKELLFLGGCCERKVLLFGLTCGGFPTRGSFPTASGSSSLAHCRSDHPTIQRWIQGNASFGEWQRNLWHSWSLRAVERAGVSFACSNSVPAWKNVHVWFCSSSKGIPACFLNSKHLKRWNSGFAGRRLWV